MGQWVTSLFSEFQQPGCLASSSVVSTCSDTRRSSKREGCRRNCLLLPVTTITRVGTSTSSPTRGHLIFICPDALMPDYCILLDEFWKALIHASTSPRGWRPAVPPPSRMLTFSRSPILVFQNFARRAHPLFLNYPLGPLELLVAVVRLGAPGATEHRATDQGHVDRVSWKIRCSALHHV